MEGEPSQPRGRSHPRRMTSPRFGVGTHRGAGQPSGVASCSCGPTPTRSRHPHPGCTHTGSGRRPPRRCSPLQTDRDRQTHTSALKSSCSVPRSPAGTDADVPYRTLRCTRHPPHAPTPTNSSKAAPCIHSHCQWMASAASPPPPPCSEMSCQASAPGRSQLT